MIIESELGRFGTFQVRIKDFFICSWRSHLFAFTWSDRSTGQMTFSQTRLSTKKKYKIYSLRDHNLISLYEKVSFKMGGHETPGSRWQKLKDYPVFSKLQFWTLYTIHLIICFWLLTSIGPVFRTVDVRRWPSTFKLSKIHFRKASFLSHSIFIFTDIYSSAQSGRLSEHNL